MFVQVMQGQVTDVGEVRAALYRWVDELSPDASGWLGTTAGVTDDGQFVAVARFESEEAARRNSDRPEQGQWWAETAKLLRGDVTFLDSTEVDVDIIGDPDQAGFVQIIQAVPATRAGRVTSWRRTRRSGRFPAGRPRQRRRRARGRGLYRGAVLHLRSRSPASGC